MEHIRSFVTQFGDAAWWVVARADTGMRSEQMERLRRQLSGKPESGFTKATVFPNAIKDQEFWTKELVPQTGLQRAGELAGPWRAAGTQHRHPITGVFPRCRPRTERLRPRSKYAPSKGGRITRPRLRRESRPRGSHCRLHRLGLLSPRYEQAAAELGYEPVLNKLGDIVKYKEDSRGNQVRKSRVIWDLKALRSQEQTRCATKVSGSSCPDSSTSCAERCRLSGTPDKLIWRPSTSRTPS